MNMRRAAALETRAVAAVRIQEPAIFSFCWKYMRKAAIFLGLTDRKKPRLEEQITEG